MAFLLCHTPKKLSEIRTHSYYSLPSLRISRLWQFARLCSPSLFTTFFSVFGNTCTVCPAARAFVRRFGRSRHLLKLSAREPSLFTRNISAPNISTPCLSHPVIHPPTHHEVDRCPFRGRIPCNSRRSSTRRHPVEHSKKAQTAGPQEDTEGRWNGRGYHRQCIRQGRILCDVQAGDTTPITRPSARHGQQRHLGARHVG